MISPVRNVIRPIKRQVLGALQATGTFRMLAQSTWRNRRLLILCYHGVSLLDEHVQDPELFMQPGLLHARFELLRQRGYAVLPLIEAVERLQAGTLPARSVVLTFDDGMYNFGAAAFPLLRRFGFPATVYLSTYYCIHNEPVFNPLIAYLLRKSRGKVVDARVALAMEDVWDLRTFSGMLDAFWMVYRAAERRQLTRVEKTEFARRVALVLGMGSEYKQIIAKRMFHLLNPDEVASLSRRGVDFQLHTHRHISPVNRDLFLREIEDNRRHIVSITGKTPQHFCYPAGNWRREFLPWLREAQVRTATTTEAVLAEADDETLLLPRVTDNEGRGGAEFEGWLTGFLCTFTRRNGHAPA